MTGASLGIVAAGLAGAAVAAVGYRWARALGEVRRGIAALGDGRPTRPVQSQVGGPVGGWRVFDVVAPRSRRGSRELEQDRQQLSAVLGGMAEGVIAVDPRRRLLFANASADRLFGLDASSVGRLVPELIRSPQVQEAVEATLAWRPAAYQGEITLPAASPRCGAATGPLGARHPAARRPAVRGAVLVFHDVTELRRLERMRQDFVANASHELKTPLASIKAYTETLLDWALHDETVNARFLKRIDEQAERLNQLILDLLSLARLESGQEVFDHGPLRARARCSNRASSRTATGPRPRT